MRIAIFSDVHGNLNALQAVLNDLIKKRVDDIYFLGDLCTLGPNPIEVAEVQLNSILKSIMPKSNTDNVVSDLPLKAWLLGQYSI
jgi:predicted phosphodiesterase